MFEECRACAALQATSFSRDRGRLDRKDVTWKCFCNMGPLCVDNVHHAGDIESFGASDDADDAICQFDDSGHGIDVHIAHHDHLRRGRDCCPRYTVFTNFHVMIIWFSEDQEDVGRSHVP